jgi:PAS domain S-box-containing protein
MENKKIKILAIDDNKDNLITLNALVKESFPDSKIFSSTTGAEGLSIAVAEDPDLILLDIVMPDMDGFEVCKKLKANMILKDIPVVFITAIKGDKDSRIKALEVGAEAFLAKPIDETELIAQIRAMCKIKKANVEKRDEKLILSKLVEEQTRELIETHKATLNLMEDLKKENDARKKSENDLFENEKRSRGLLDNLEAGIVIHAKDTSIITSNKRASELLGLSVEQMQGKTAVDSSWHFIFENKQPIPINEYPVNIIKSTKHSFNNYILGVSRPDTKDVGWLMVNGFPFLNDNGEITEILISFIDITNRKVAEELLRKSEEKYRLLFDSNKDGVSIFYINDDNSVSPIIIANKSASEMLGYTSEEFIGKHVSDFELNASVNPLLERMVALKTNGFFDFETELFHKNGQKIFAAIHIRIIEYNDRLAIMNIVSDITERKKAEIALKESEEKFREMADMLPQVVFETDENGNFTFINKQAYNVFGYEEDFPVLKENSLKFHIPEERERAIDSIQLRISGNKVENNEYTMLRKDGTTFQALVYSNPIIKNNKNIGIRGIIVDISERKQSEIDLKKKTAELEQMNEYFVGREIKMIELKKEINKLLISIGEKEKYVVHTL